MAVDVVLTSPHPENKVAATLFSAQAHLSRTNDWPQPIRDKIGMTTRIGDSSGTLHAEVNCLLHFSAKAEGASLAITDPCCPNCAKYIAESGIKHLYIDHKGFEKNFALRRGDEFEDMSLRILAHAGITIDKVHRKSNVITTIYAPPKNYSPPEDNPIEIKPSRAPISDDTLMTLARLVRVKHPRWGCALATDTTGKTWTLVASAHPAIGFTEHGLSHTDLLDTGKYDFYLEPVNRLLMGAARKGLRLLPDMIWCSVLPSPREMVNLIGAGLSRLRIGDIQTHKKASSEEAFRLLAETGLVQFLEEKLT